MSDKDIERILSAIDPDRFICPICNTGLGDAHMLADKMDASPDIQARAMRILRLANKEKENPKSICNNCYHDRRRFEEKQLKQGKKSLYEGWNR